MDCNHGQLPRSCHELRYVPPHYRRLGHGTASSSNPSAGRRPADVRTVPGQKTTCSPSALLPTNLQPPASNLPLTARTPIRAAPLLRRPLDQRLAARAAERLAFIHLQLTREVASILIDADVVAEAGAAGQDRFLEHVADRHRERVTLGPAQ